MALSEAVEACDPYTRGHSARVADMAAEVGRRLECDAAQIALLRLGGALHDVGKVNVRAEVLAKPGRLDDGELAEIRAHPVEGMWLIAGVPSLQPALPYVLFHHERWDGLGYPTRRSGAAIPVEGRMLAVADAFDAMTSGRPYRGSLTPDEAAAEIERCAGTQFDPEVVGAFLTALDAREIVSGCTAVAA